MNKIELTAEHMAKIFDMCNYFFVDTVVAGAVIVDGMILFKDFNNEFKKVHWLELCLTHLSSKVLFTPSRPKHYAQDKHFRLLDNVMKLFNDEDKFTHPVDFIHSEYLKNKK